MGIRILIALVLALALIPFAHSLAISDVKVLKTTSTSATISWQTDDPSSGRVRYGLTSSLGFSSVHQELRTNHTILLSGLLSGRTYSFEVASALFDGNEVTDDNEDALYTLTTKDVIPPSKVSGLKVLFSTPSSIGLGWDPSSTGDISHYLIYENRILLANVSASQNPSFNHTSIIQGATYSYKVSAVDTSLNEGQLSDTLSITSEKEDSTLPRLLGVDFENATDTSVQVNILTDKETTAHIRHGILTLTDFESDDRFLTTHSFELSNLRKNTTYQVSIEMCDRFNNCLISNTTYRAGRDFGEQFINASLPRFWSRRTIDIFGSTKPYSEVSLYVNNLNLPLRFLGSSDTGPSGIISFRGIFLNQENVIKLVSKNKLGQSKETLFEVNVDTDSPVVAFKTIADVTSRKNLTIEGSTNEPVIIRAYVRSSKEKATTPKNLSGFRNDSISPNAVTLKWNAVNDPDFSHYILRRSDVGAIAIIQPSSYTAYTDILADAGRTYTYTLSYMNEFGKESAQTPPVIATMPSSGIVLGIKPSLVDIMQDFRKPTKQIEVNASGAFTLSFIVGSQDGAYDVKLEAIDRAGNRMGVEKEVLLDTKIPEIKITSPPNNAVVFESYANSIDIKGVTEPNTRVHLFVGRTPFNMANLTFDISGLKKDIEDLPETSLDADCKAIIRSKDMCGTNADFSTTSDSQGNFQFEGVDATSLFSAAGSLQEVDEKDFSASNTNIKQSRKAKFVVIATDRSGLRNAVQSELSIGTCWSGNLSWDVIPLSEYQSPTLISTERLTENTESIYFYFNYSYIGPSTSGTRKIKSVTLTKACGTKEVLDPRFNISCQILPSGAQAIKVNPEGTVSYSAIKLNSIKGMDRWLSGEWKDFFSTINKELSFPFKVTITYEHEINGRKTQDVQTTCQEVTYVLDNSRIDPREVLPDWLLYDFVDYLNESLFTIRQVQEQIDAIMPYVATGCLASYVSNFGTQVYRRWVEIFEEKKWLVKEFTDSFWDTSFGSNPNKEHCKTLIQGMIASKAYGKPFRLSYLSDSDLEKCFPPAYSAWKAEEATYKAYRYACDRLFGHTTPAYWTRDKTDSQLLNKVSSGSACANDQTAYGQRLRKVKCADISSSYASDTPYSRDAECLEVTSTLSSTISPTSSSRVSG
ncbi:MAG TPA: fibronectin type III domain-containing protein, partial [Candidatus Nanoarchaeia archaeon]|nr:fibronectin type III domain-containing protein [Candidatus Nanoarchaeia archaeon]